MSCGAQWYNLSSHQSQLFQVCCGWAVVAVGTLVGRDGPQTGWLLGLADTSVGMLVYGAGSRHCWLCGLVMTAMDTLMGGTCLWPC